MEQLKKWLVVYTKPKWEKKVDLNFAQKGIESWCPTQKKERQWSDRKKIIEEAKEKLLVIAIEEIKKQIFLSELD